MYLHIGNNKILRSGSVIGIFDMDTATVSQITRRYLVTREKEKKVISVTGEVPKSFILTDSGTIYLSQLSPKTLLGRMDKIDK